MVKNISIENFKSIRSLSFEARRVNVFIGEPNTGKSNILEALGLYSAEYVSSLNEIVRYKNISNLFSENVSQNGVKVRLDKNELFLRLNSIFSNGNLNEEVIINVQKGRNTTPIVSYTFNGENGVWIVKGDIGLSRDVMTFPKFFRFKLPKKFINTGKNYLIPSDGRNLFEVLSANKDVREIVSGIISEKGFKLRLYNGPQEILIEQNEEVLFPYEVLSDTIQRVIFFLVAILSNQNSTLIFEEPESNIFPFYNQYLAETIGLDEESGNQYFIATHNPYFLGSIAQKTKTEDLAVFITYMENHETKLRRLREDEFPELFDYDIFYNLDRFIES